MAFIIIIFFCFVLIQTFLHYIGIAEIICCNFFSDVHKGTITLRQLNHKAPITVAAENISKHFILIHVYFSKEIRFDISCQSSTYR